MPQSENVDRKKLKSVERLADVGWRRDIDSSPEGITDRKELDTALLFIAEDQQRRVGRDIHDDLCSQLSGIGCLTKVLENQMRGDQQQESMLLRRITKMVAHAGLTAREIAQGIAPSVVDVQGLVGALQELANRQRKLYGMDCALEVANVQPIEDLESIVRIQIYRIAQEAVSNAIRHSDADRIVIGLSATDNSIDFTVTDDGKGMAEDLVSIGMGLTTMKRRAELINAAFSIQASLGAGATIHCSIPLHCSIPSGS